MAVFKSYEDISQNESSIAAELSGLQTTYDVFRFMKALTARHNFLVFSLLAVPSLDAETIENEMYISNWFPEFRREFDGLNGMSDSPIFEQLRESSRPISWNIEDVAGNRNTERAKQIIDLHKRYNLTMGTLFPVHDAQGRRRAVTFAGNREELGLEELQLLNFTAIHVFDRFSQIQRETDAVVPELNEVELQSLAWTAAGKTSSEIATILGISEHTITHHLTNVCRKFEAVNRTQVVAKAIRLGVIS